MNNVDKRKQVIQDFLSKPVCKNALQMALPKVGITPERMIRLVFSAITQIPRLAECTPMSLFNAMIQCAQIGLEPNTSLGQAYMLPFRDNKTRETRVQLIIGYKGYIALARRSGDLSSIASHPVYNGDVFEFEYGTNEYICHKPDLSVEHEAKDMLHVYAVAKFKDGGTAFEIMSRWQVEGMRRRSKSPDSGPWVTDYIQMARKTAIRRLMNYLPLSTEMAQAMKYDSENEVGIQDMSEAAMDFELPMIDEPKAEVDPLQKMAEEHKKEPDKKSEKNSSKLAI